MELRQIYYMIVWPIAGAAIGYAAAQRRGFSPAIGLGLGMLFGPLFAWLLFLVNGIFSANERKRCPHCAEWLEPTATVCRFCQRDVPPERRGPARLLRLVRRRPSPTDDVAEGAS
jgi:hypothetical protein